MSNINPNKYIPINFIYGGISGMCGVLISHPFDTIKTNYQEKKPFKFDLNINIIRKLYKGFIPPLFGVGFEKAMVFGIYESSKNLMENQITNDKFKIAVSGGLSGFGASIVVTPFERIKILLQTNNNKKIALTPHFLFKGLSATFSRETPGFAIYFSIYEYMKSKYYINNKDITAHGSFLLGGIAGTISWIFIYPQDRIKTKMQANIIDINNTFASNAKEIYCQEGIKGFYRGFHYALMRAIPLHAGTFMTMEIIKKHYEI